MNLISLESISKSFGDQFLFQDLFVGIESGQKVGLIAKNGTGKTSLLKIMAGLDKPDTGIVSVNKEIKLGFLSQDPDLHPENTVFEEIYTSNTAELNAIAFYEACLIDESKMHLIEKAIVQMDELHAWDYEVKLKQILSILKVDFFEKQIKNLSGGQKKRVALAKVLIDSPDLLILDEPTNHLDLEMIEWLEEYLDRANMGLFMVTHDRYFLENVCNEILEMDNGKLYKYKGDYNYFLEKKAERMDQENAETSKAQNLMRKELEWVRRQPKARTTKSKARLDAFEDVKIKAKKRVEDKKLLLEVNMSRLGTKVLELHNIGKHFNDKWLIKNFDYKFARQERIGVVGRNGVGKTTFLNMITGQEQPDQGKIVVGETIVFGYYQQSGLNLNNEKRVIEVIKDIAEFIPLAKGKKLSAVQILERFLFPLNMHYNYVHTLSGGEKKRLYLLTLLMKNPNFLILDEPTNDLDIPTIQVLEEFLDEYPGILLIVSHDRSFVDRIADHLFVLDGTGNVQDFPGNYTDYRILKEQEVKTEQAEKQKVAELKKEENKKEKVPSKMSYKEKQEFDTLEKDISKMEKEKIKLSEEMGKNLNFEEMDKISKKYKQLEETLEEKMMRWLELSEM